MSAHLMSLHRCCQRSARLLVAGRPWSSSSVSSPPLHTRLLLFLTQRFYDVEMLLRWRSQQGQRRVQKKNAYYSYTQHFHGADIAAAFYVLSLKGGFRYVGQSDWFHTDKRGQFNWNFLNHKDTPLEEVDMSCSLISYSGLENLVGQQSLRTLSLQGCPEVDDWFLARLHVFQDSLEELDISHCPRITTGGLAALRNLKGLRRLDMSSLPGLSNPGLVIILLEEMLPQCQIIASGYDLSLSQEGIEERNEQHEQGHESDKSEKQAIY
ncbi:distal membrane-arm assembly complex 2 [Solea senegalensis]|uniref:Distal membrane-arm assembly complex protein 2 n=2 Tax=Solea senegalensis TaxID=28829 RepID=A0AAV6PYA3_SOLSE|nr:distal membrane-arm assembly complex protein 2 [Solea senegalensis]KAG7479603.1 distal membrane-arm assembly complex 2 [Solea senegalensis]